MIITDQGPGFIGEAWDTSLESWICSRVMTATRAAHSIGIAELQISLVKSGYARLEDCQPELSPILVMGQVLIAKNLSPSLNTGLCAMRSFFGRADLFSPLVNSSSISLGDLVDSDAERSALYQSQNHLRRLVDLREFICKQDALRIVRTCDAHNLRAGAKLSISIGDSVDIFVPFLNRWVSGYRCVGKIDAQIIIEKGRTTKKMPCCMG